ncbi:MAG: YDG domain-containing protein [Agathobacter sp.]
MKRRLKKVGKRVIAAILAVSLIAGGIPATRVSAEENEALKLTNGFITVEVSGDNGGFAIRTAEGDKLNKDDNDKKLLFHDGEEDTSFTSFQVTRDGKVKEYIFGEDYPGSSRVEAVKTQGAIIAKWSVDQLTFTETINLVNSGNEQHGMVSISYNVENSGAPAEIKARILMDTALGDQDYAYYNTGDPSHLVEYETQLEEGKYDKTFYAMDDFQNPSIIAYTVNASVNNLECKPYRTIFAHWNSLATTMFDYTPDTTLNFTNAYNKRYMTADSAYAQYFDLGTVNTDQSAVIGTNYGIFSNEKVDKAATAAVNLVAPEVLELTEDRSAYQEDGIFTINTQIQNISENTFDKVRVLVYTTGDIMPLDENGNPTNATYSNPYTKEFLKYDSEQIQSLVWKFKAVPGKSGEYAKVTFKVYDVSDDATMNTDQILAENLMGENSCYILCPGSVTRIPEIKFTSGSPEILYSKGTRNLYVTGSNFSMLADQGDYSVKISRLDGRSINGQSSVDIPAEHVKIDEQNNIINFVLNDEYPGTLPTGRYRITFDYNDSTKEDLTAPALTFEVKDEPQYRNDTYGLLAVVKDENRNYHIQNFASDAEFQKAIENGSIVRDNSLLEFRGVFTKLNTTDGSIKYSGVSLSSEDNVMTLNNCLDIENGEVTITEKDGSVCVDFDAKLYTTGERTSVWSGVCALTELEAGKDFGLVPYDEDGNRKGYSYNTITLLWPSVGQAAQNLLGFLMEFKYGELGVIRHEGADDTRVVGFGASMNLGFVVPDYAVNPAKPTPLEQAHENLLKARTMDGNALRKINKQIPYNSSTQKSSANKKTDNGKKGVKTPTGKVQVEDVLFGGKYIGVNLTIQVAVPSYVDGMPQMEGTLTVKTVGDWKVGVKGVMDYTNFLMEGEIAIKSYKNIAVPDKIRFFVGNMTPGINLDGFGVLWLQGAGGGIDNLYNTIFLTDAVPPLSLILEAQFSLMQVISARASLELSLRGIGAELSDGMVLDTIKVLNSAKLQFKWYPEFRFLTSVDLEIFNAIKGGGYIVVEQNGFFEFFVRASLQIPDSVPIVGGIQVGAASLGANSEKIWGSVSVLMIDFGVVYYWGSESIDWGSGASASPTYPELVGMASAAGILNEEDTPVYYDEETGRTLYMHVGTNVSNARPAVIADQTQGVMRVGWTRTSSDAHELTSSVDTKNHTLTLKPKTKDELLTITWEAESMEDAAQYVANNGVTIQKMDGGQAYPLKLLDHTKAVEEQQDANANLTYDNEKKQATLSITFTEEQYFNTQWKIDTQEASGVILYDVDPLPEMSDGTTAVVDEQTNQIKVTLKGEQLDKFDSINFVAVPLQVQEEEEKQLSQSSAAKSWLMGGLLSLRGAEETVSAEQAADETDSDGARLVYHAEKPAGFQDGEVITFDIPEDLQSGTYQLRMSATDENAMYQSEVEKAVTYTNPKQPGPAAAVTASNAGDYKLDVTLNAPENKENVNGYCITVYDSDGNTVDGVSNLMYDSNGESLEYNQDGTIQPVTAEKDSITVQVGGQYQIPVTENGKSVSVTKGLLAGQSYRIGVRAWKITEDGKSILYSEETKSEPVEVTQPVDTTLTLQADSEFVNVTRTRMGEDGKELSFTTPTYRKKDLQLTLQASAKVSGIWTVDGGEKEGCTGTVEKTNETQTIVISQKDLEEGVHTLSFTGKNEYGDSVAESFTFGVDTLAPRLLLSEPVNGAVFDRKTNKLTISGVTDQNAMLSVKNLTTGNLIVDNVKVTVDSDGNFTREIQLDASMAVNKLGISMKDEVGNEVTKEISLVNNGLSAIQEVQLWSGDTEITNTVLEAGKEYPLSMKAILTDGSSMNLDSLDTIDWQQTSVEGNATIKETEGGSVLEVSEDSRGMVTGQFTVSDAGAYSVSAAFGNRENKALAPDTILYNGATEKNWYGIADGDVMISAAGYTVSDAWDGDYKISYTMPYTQNGTLSKTLYFKDAQGQKTDGVTVDVQYDRTLPNAEIQIDTKKWTTFLNGITFGQFFKETKEVTITAKDTDSGVAGTKYYISNCEMSETDIAALDESAWSEGNSFRIDPKNKYVIYAKVTDNAGNAAVINSEGIVIYAESTLSPETIEYTYNQNEDREIRITKNGNTFDKLTDAEGNTIGAENYTIDEEAGTLTLKAAYLNKLSKGTYSYKILMKPMGEDTDQVTLAYNFMVDVKARELSVTGAAAASRKYDTKNKVEITSVTLSGVKTGDKVGVDTTNLMGTLSSADSGTYTAVTLPLLTLTGEDTENYILVQPTGAVTTNVRIEKADAEISVGTAEYDKTFGDASFMLADVTDNNAEAEVQYAVTSGADVVSISNGMVEILKAGTATITVKLPESKNYHAAADKTITVNVAKRSGFTVDTINKIYFYGNDNADTIDLSTLLPEKCGTAAYGTPEISGNLYTDNGQPQITDGKLSYTVKAATSAGATGSIQVKVTTENHADYTITVNIEQSEKVPVYVKEGTSVTLQNDTLTFGEALSKLTFNHAVFTDNNGNEVTGTLAWKEPDKTPDVLTTTASWIFTPDEKTYASLEGIVEIHVNKATPEVTVVPKVADRIYHPTAELTNQDLSGGTVSVAGTWQWQAAKIVPTVNNSGYVAEFYPTDNLNYQMVTRTIPVKVAKAAPCIMTVPAASAITYGDTLGASTLTGGNAQYNTTDTTEVAGRFVWKDTNEKPARTGSDSSYPVVFIPFDQDNYNTVETAITLTVEKAENAPNMPSSVMNVSNSMKKVSDVPLSEGWTWQEADKDKELEVGKAVMATAVYTGADKDNYKNVTVSVSITKSVCDHNHTEVRGGIAASCTRVGYTGDIYCSDCGELLTLGTEIPLTDHQGGTATCSKKAVCIMCGQEYGEFDPNHHAHSGLRDVVSASCSAGGYTGDTYCTDCGAKISSGKATPKLGHHYVSKVTKQPTTEREGIMTYTCDRCGHSYIKAINKLRNPGSQPDNREPENNQPVREPENDQPVRQPDNREPENNQPGSQPGDHKSDTEEDKLDTGTPFLKEDSGKTGWDAIRKELEMAKDGETFVVDMNGSTIVPGEVLSDIKGKDITLVFDMGNGITWSVNGKSITTDQVGDIDFAVETGTTTIPVDVISNVTGERYTIQIRLAYDGEFGFDAVLSINMGKENAGLFANLFYYEESAGKLEFICADKIAEDGTANLTFTHASDYTIVIDTESMDEAADAHTSESGEKTGHDGWNYWWIIVAGIAIFAFILVIVFAKKKKKE